VRPRALGWFPSSFYRHLYCSTILNQHLAFAARTGPPRCENLLHERREHYVSTAVGADKLVVVKLQLGRATSHRESIYNAPGHDDSNASSTRGYKVYRREKPKAAALSFAPVRLAPARRLTFPDQQQNLQNAAGQV